MLMPAECGGAALPRNAQRHFPKTGLWRKSRSLSRIFRSARCARRN